MAIGLERVNTRKVAMAARFGYAPGEVAADQFTDEYIGVFIDAYRREGKPSSRASWAADSPIVCVYWDDVSLRDEARQAIDDDWAETLGLAGDAN